MKKLVFSLLTVAGSFSFLSAQQLNYYVDMTGNVGQSFIVAQDTALDPTETTSSIFVTGTGQVWNFQTLDADAMDTINYIALSGPEAAAFATGNVVNESNVARVVMDRDPSTGLYALGSLLDFAGYPVTLALNPPQQLLPAVCTLGSMSSTSSTVDARVYVGIDTSFGSAPLDCHIYIDTIRIYREQDYMVDFQSSGEVRLPLDTFAYALCGISKTVSTDSIFIYAPQASSGFGCAAANINIPVGWSLAPDVLIQFTGMGTSSVMVDSTFAAGWYVPYMTTPVAVLDFDFDPNYTDTNYYSVRYKGTNTPDVGFEEVNIINLKLFPNPASSIMTLQTSYDLANATIYMYNAQGQQVRATRLNGSNTIDVTALNDGVYFYQLAEDKKLLSQGKFIVQK